MLLSELDTIMNGSMSQSILHREWESGHARLLNGMQTIGHHQLLHC